MARANTADWERLEELFQTAVDLPADQRSAFLDQACAGDAALREELDSLLAADTSVADSTAAGLAAAIAREAGSLFTGGVSDGTFVGPYRIVREIGRGGMGSVFLAIRDDDQYRKEVAVKLIRHGMDTADVLARFRHERQILANLEHPYIARLLDGGSSADGRPFLVMEYVTGQTLDAWCKANPCRDQNDIRHRCELFLLICEAVSYAHRNLIVHRDLKPANIFVTPGGSPKLLDFGVAKLLSDPDGLLSADARTVSTTRVLTFDYASPEQIRGNRITTATDIYSLGAILYEMLTGVRAQRFTTETTIGVTREIERVICETDPPRLGDAAPQLRQRLRGDLEAIVSMAMRKEQDRRYPSVEQLTADLRRYLSGWPVKAREGSFAYLAGTFLRRNRAPLAIGCTIAVTLAGIAAFATVQAVEARRERLLAIESQRQAESSRRAAEVQASEAQHQRSNAQLQSDLAQTQRLLAERRFEQIHQLSGKFLTDFHDAIAQLPGSTPARRMVVETGLRYYDILVADAGDNRDLLEEIARGYDRLGDVQGNPYFGNLGDIPGGEASYRKALAIRARVSDPSPAFQRDRLMGQVRLAQILIPQGKLPEAEKALQTALAFNTGPASASYEVRDGLASVWSTYGDVKIRAGVSGEAIEPYRRLLQLSTTLARETKDPVAADRRLSVANSKLGDALGRAQRAAEALPIEKAALAIDQRLAAANPNNTGIQRKLFVSYGLLADLLHEGPGRSLAPPAEVLGYLQGAVDVATRLAVADPDNRQYQRDISTSAVALGDWQRSNHDFAAAVANYRRALAAAEKVNATAGSAGPEGVDMQAWHRLGAGLAEAGQYEEALASLDKADALVAEAERRTPGVPLNAQRRAEILTARTTVYLGQKHWNQAIAAIRATLTIHEEQARRDPGSEQFVITQPVLHSRLADAFIAAGQPAAAAAELRTALSLWQQIAARRPLVPEELESRRYVTDRLAGIE